MNLNGTSEKLYAQKTDLVPGKDKFGSLKLKSWNAEMLKY